MTLDWLSWSNPVAIWWSFLVAVSSANILLWLILHRRLRNTAVAPSRRILGLELMVLLCAAYVFGCAFRSLLPRADVQRICLFDTWLSSVIVGRSINSFPGGIYSGLSSWIDFRNYRRGKDGRGPANLGEILGKLS